MIIIIIIMIMVTKIIINHLFSKAEKLDKMPCRQLCS